MVTLVQKAVRFASAAVIRIDCPAQYGLHHSRCAVAGALCAIAEEERISGRVERVMCVQHPSAESFTARIEKTQCRCVSLYQRSACASVAKRFGTGSVQREAGGLPGHSPVDHRVPVADDDGSGNVSVDRPPIRILPIPFELLFEVRGRRVRTSPLLPRHLDRQLDGLEIGRQCGGGQRNIDLLRRRASRNARAVVAEPERCPRNRNRFPESLRLTLDHRPVLAGRIIRLNVAMPGWLARRQRARRIARR